MHACQRLTTSVPNAQLDSTGQLSCRLNANTARHARAARFRCCYTAERPCCSVLKPGT